MGEELFPFEDNTYTDKNHEEYSNRSDKTRTACLFGFRKWHNRSFLECPVYLAKFILETVRFEIRLENFMAKRFALTCVGLAQFGDTSIMSITGSRVLFVCFLDHLFMIPLKVFDVLAIDYLLLLPFFLQKHELLLKLFGLSNRLQTRRQRKA